jgi:hypothetical protein
MLYFVKGEFIEENNAGKPMQVEMKMPRVYSVVWNFFARLN